MRRRSTERGREVPPELVDLGASWERADERDMLAARFAGRSPGADLAADVARAGGVEVVDLAASLPAGTTLEVATVPALVTALPRARQHAARGAWLARNLPPEQHEDARMAMVKSELFR